MEPRSGNWWGSRKYLILGLENKSTGLEMIELTELQELQWWAKKAWDKYNFKLFIWLSCRVQDYRAGGRGFKAGPTFRVFK